MLAFELPCESFEHAFGADGVAALICAAEIVRPAFRFISSGR